MSHGKEVVGEMAGEPPILEVIAGRPDGAAPHHRIAIEAVEEGGVELGQRELVVHAGSMPSISTEKLHLYVAQYNHANRVNAGGGSKDEQEQFTVHELSLDHLAEVAGRGLLTDAKTRILVQRCSPSTLTCLIRRLNRGP